MRQGQMFAEAPRVICTLGSEGITINLDYGPNIVSYRTIMTDEFGGRQIVSVLKELGHEVKVQSREGA